MSQPKEKPLDSTVLTYSLSERDRRWNVARALMEEEGVDALLVVGEHEDSGPAPVSWDTWFTNGRPGSTIVFPRSGEPIELTPYHLFILDNSMAVQQDNAFWIPAKNMRLGRSSDVVIQVLNEMNLERSTIGVLGLDAAPPWHMEGLIPYQMWNRILQSLRDATFRSVSDTFARTVMVMGEEELQMLRRSAAIGEKMAKAMVEVAKVGSTDTAMYEAANSVAHRHGTVAPGTHLFVGPENAAAGPPQWSYRPQGPRTIRNGDAVHSEVFGTVGQRHTQHQLSMAIGDAHPNVERAGAVARECYEAGLKTLRPGIRFSEVCNAMLEPVEKSDGWVRGPQLHSLNPLLALCGTPKSLADRFNQVYEAEGYPPQHSMDHYYGDLILQPGMVFAFEPSCAIGKHLVTIGCTVIVTENGAEELNPFTTRLIKVPGKENI